MSTIAVPVRLRGPVGRFMALSPGVRVALGVGALALVSLGLRSMALHSRYWIDEGLSVGIGSHPLLDIPGLLRMDGSPPLYYMLLGAWMGIFDNGEADTHGLSVIFAVLCVPAAFLAARALFGARAGWIAAFVAAINPFLTFYAEETRMYSLVSLLSIAVAATFALAFVQRRRAWLPAFAGSLALLVYTHNWGLFLAFGTLVALLPVARAALDRRRVLRDAALAYGAVALVYLPWVPTLLFQAQHTGAPWSDRPNPEAVLTSFTVILGGRAPGMAFALAAGSGIATMLSARARAPEARALIAIGAIGGAALLVAWLASQVSPAWSTRYLSVLMGPLLLVGAAGLSRAGRLGLVVVALLFVFWFHPRTHALESKSNAHNVAILARDLLQPGDVVLSTHPEQVPVMHIYLPQNLNLRWWTSMGPVADPQIMDWRDALDRLKAAKPKKTSDALLRSMKPGQHLLLIRPIIKTAGWRAPWTKLVRKRVHQWGHRLYRDPRLVRMFAFPRLAGKPLPRGVRAVLYERL
jgi:mannosyltransferase